MRMTSSQNKLSKIANWAHLDRVTGGKVTRLTFLSVFLNDQVYARASELYYLVKGMPEMWGNPVIRREARDMRSSYVRKGYALIDLLGKHSDFCSDINRYMEDEMEKHWTIFCLQISQALLDIRLTGNANKVATAAIGVNVMTQMLRSTVDNFRRMVCNPYFIMTNPLEDLLQTRVGKCAIAIADCFLIDGKPVNLNDCEMINKAFAILVDHVVNAPAMERAWQYAEAEAAKSYNNN